MCYRPKNNDAWESSLNPVKVSIFAVSLCLIIALMCACAGRPPTPTTAAIGISRIIRNTENKDIKATSIIICNVVESIKALNDGDALELQKLFGKDWGPDTSRDAKDIQDIITAEFTNWNIPINGTEQEYKDYIVQVLTLTCKRLQVEN